MKVSNNSRWSQPLEDVPDIHDSDVSTSLGDTGITSARITDITAELSNPLATAEASLSTLMTPGYSDLTPRSLDLVQIAHRQLRLASALIANLDSIARHSQHIQTYESTLVDPQVLLAQLARDFQPLANHRQVRLIHQPDTNPVKLYTCAPALRDILSALVENAVNYTAASGQVELSTLHRSDTLEIKVRDTGIGIASADKPYIFTRLFRANTPPPDTSNRPGLGLYTASQIAKLINADIRCATKLHHGSTFAVVMSLNPNTL